MFPGTYTHTDGRGPQLAVGGVAARSDGLRQTASDPGVAVIEEVVTVACRRPARPEIENCEFPLLMSADAVYCLHLHRGYHRDYYAKEIVL